MTSPTSTALGAPVPSARATVLVAALAAVVVLVLAFTARDPFYLAPFRESQTAISADYLIREPGGFLTYQLPVLGAPWRVPFEFPLFQQLTAWAARLGLGVAQAGRVVSLVCFAGCLWVAGRLLAAWQLPKSWMWPALALIAAAPVHAAYATSHMIESLALLCGLVHMWAFWRFLEGKGRGWFGLSLLGGVLVALVKITTWLPFGCLLGLAVASRIWAEFRERGRAKVSRGRWLGPVALVLLPLLAGQMWSKWCEQVRVANVLSEATMNPRHLQDWVFGNWELRLSPKNWALLLAKHLLLLFGPLGVGVPPLLWLAWRRGAGWASQGNRVMLLATAAYLVHTVLLLRPHLRHDYYLFGSGIFLLIAVVFAMAVLQPSTPSAWFRWLPLALVVSMSSVSLAYVTARRSYRDLAAEQVIRALEQVPEAGALITFGLDWSPRIPFALNRKALMIADQPEALRALDAALRANAATRFAAVVVVGAGFDEPARRAAVATGLEATRRIYFWRDGYLLLPAGATLRDDDVGPGTGDVLLAELARRVPPRRSLPDGLAYRRLPFSRQPGHGLEVVVKRGADAFFYRTDGNELVRVRGYFAGP